MLTKKQLKVARALYEGNLSEKEIVEQLEVSERVLSRWLNNEEFQGELARLSERSARETRFIISRWGPVAAMKLAELIGSDKPDTARRAALDLIDRCLHSPAGNGKESDELIGEEISDEEAKKMLLTLAEGIGGTSKQGKV